MIQKGRSYSSKVLLFGEYTLMSGSMALSIPFHNLNGQLFFEEGGTKSTHYSVEYLEDYLGYLTDNNLNNILDLKSFRDDIHNGLFFETNIPISYGLGSSGAIVASVYDAYSREKTEDYLKLKSLFSLMESYYHGKSSGLDPLVSYTNKPILFEADNSIKSVKIPGNHNSGSVFLIDTETSGETQPLVNWYIDSLNNPSFRDIIVKQLVPLNNLCITDFLTNPMDDYYNNIGQLSEMTLLHLRKMIPESIVDIWEYGLNSKEYYLKLCGSGGGGMMIGFTFNFEKIQTSLEGRKIIKLLDI